MWRCQIEAWRSISGIQNYINLAEQKKFDQDMTWQRLMYADQSQTTSIIIRDETYIFEYTVKPNAYSLVCVFIWELGLNN
ncbi:MAG TPA: hypothetical protein EYP08_05435, partial [Pyrodictiaceae archaeon]|nr:hypothetical protein [Pyrodictiaceae archaeon]